MGKSSGAYDKGGGIFLQSSTSQVFNNVIEGNSAASGAGLSIWGWGAGDQLSGNEISNNNGNGVHVWYNAHPILDSNVISNNSGGGVYILNYAHPTLNANLIIGNSAGQGGGVRIESNAPSILSDNWIYQNDADTGGGVYLSNGDATLINNVIAENQAGIVGSGLYIRRSSPQLLHTTVARNSGGDGSGIHVTNDGVYYSVASMTDTIVVSHTAGITVADGNTVRLEATLWGVDVWANDNDWAGEGDVIGQFV